jgi:PAS domain S-box-containing protein
MNEKLKILYAEDEEIVASSIIRMLSKIAHIDYAKDGREAYKLYEKNTNYDVIITDILMPNLNGIDLVKKLKLNYEEIPFIIITTAYNDTDFLMEGIELKIDKFLLKPIKLDRLFDYLEEFKSILQNKYDLEEQTRKFEHYRKIVDQQNLISITDLNGVITFVNDKFCKVSGYTKDELIGQNYNIVQHPNTRKDYYEELWTTIKNKKVFRSTIENLAKDGKSFYLRGVIAPFLNNKGEIVEFISIREDATKEIEQNKEIEQLRQKEQLQDIQKAAEIQTHNLVESIPLPSFIATDLQIIERNELFEEMFLLTSLDDLTILRIIFNLDKELSILQNIPLISSTIEIEMDTYTIHYKQLSDDKVLVVLGK